ncbi:hypothetical protein DPEC_G00100890 [Dallia pectoralis]|uniref:Uncharacterized protein n=1 Tax=Dallia pectoralis TaxID=75939 RepID=A0ACC2GWK4_DALPE|nr:hypothetical protein DPEC_G00100890 [Dallia pectoralis]
MEIFQTNAVSNITKRKSLNTRPDCPKKGVILITRKDYRICANPDDPAIEKIMNFIDQGKF